ncbi:hypothetical protein Dimus_038296 [Dionaea muscipula]
MQKSYRWAPKIEGGVRRTLNAAAKLRLKDAMGDVRKTHRAGKPPPLWIAPSVWQDLLNFWATDESFKKLSAAGKKNRASDNEGLSPSLHSGGSRSFKGHARKLVS